jgi:hypothetical protein
MLRTTFRLSIALMLATALLVSPDAEARNSGPRLSAKAYYKKARLLKSRGNRQFRLFKKGGKHATKHKSHALKNHKKAKVFKLKARAAKALQKGDKSTADKLWSQAKQLEAALTGKASKSSKSTALVVYNPDAAALTVPGKGTAGRTKAKSQSVSYNKARKSYASKMSLSRTQRQQALTSGDTTLLRRSQVNRAAASRSMVKMLKAQENGLRLKAARTNDPGKKAAYSAKADKLASRATRLNRAIKAYEKQITTAASAAGAGSAGKATGTQIPDAEQPVAPTAQPKATTPAGTLGQLKAYVSNKDLSSALTVLKSMEQSAAKATGVKGLWKKFQAKRARRVLRKAAVAVGREAIRTGGAAGDQQLLEQRREYATQVRALRAAGMTPEQRQALRAELAQVPNLRTSGSKYSQARNVLRHLNRAGNKFSKKPVRRVIAALGNMVFGSVRSSNAKLDRELVREARYLTKKGPDGAVQARLLLMSAKTRGMGKTWRFKRAHRKARRALGKTIKKAIKDGDPSGVELAYQLRESYEMDRKGPDYRLSDREIGKMNKNIQRAEQSLVKNLAKQAAWIAKYPRQAQQFFGYGPDAAATVNGLARETASRLMQNGSSVPRSVIRMMSKTDGKLNARKPGILGRIARLPLKVALLPFKVLHWATVNQARHFIYNKSGGAPPPPMKPERLNQLMQAGMPRQQDMEQGYGQQGAPQTPADAMM